MNLTIYKENRRENKNKKNLQEKILRKKGKHLLHQSIISSNLYFQIIQKSLIENQNSSKYFLSHIDQIFDTLLV